MSSIATGNPIINAISGSIKRNPVISTTIVGIFSFALSSCGKNASDANSRADRIGFHDSIHSTMSEKKVDRGIGSTKVKLFLDQVEHKLLISRSMNKTGAESEYAYRFFFKNKNEQEVAIDLYSDGELTFILNEVDWNKKDAQVALKAAIQAFQQNEISPGTLAYVKNL